MTYAPAAADGGRPGGRAEPDAAPNGGPPAGGRPAWTRRLIDRLAIRDDLRVEPDPRKAAVLLLMATVLLVVFYQWGRTGGYADTGARELVRDLTAGSSVDLVGSGAYVWWGVSSLVLRVALPFGIASWLFGLRPRELGLRFRGTARHLPIYGALFLFMLPLLVAASGLAAFQKT